MASDSFTANAVQIVNRQVRPTKVAIIHGYSFGDSNSSHDEIHAALTTLFLPLNVRVFSVLELGGAGISDLVSSRAYDLIGLVGEADEFSSLKRASGSGFPLHKDTLDDNVPIVLSFTPRTHFKDSKKYLNFSDALVLCETTGRNWHLEVSRIVYRLFESLVVPSMLNIDLADVKRIAKRVGFAFNLSDDDHEKIIEMLPKDCFVARSAILHFSCKDDVRLREIYAISKSIALKKGLADSDQLLSSHSDAKKTIRRVNVKMGIRIIGNPDEEEKETSENSMIPSADYPVAFRDEKRISMTAILFGI